MKIFIKKYFTFRNVYLFLSFLNFLLFSLSLFIPSLAFWIILALPFALVMECVKVRKVRPVFELFLVYPVL